MAKPVFDHYIQLRRAFCQIQLRALILRQIPQEMSLRKLLFIAVLVMCPLGFADAKVFKCVENGKTIYQNYPCRGSGSEINVVPATDSMSSGEDAAIAQDAITAKRNSQANVLILERRLRDIDYEAQNLKADINKYNTNMNAEIKVLRERQESWKNKLGGATWEQNIEAEIQAVFEKYQLQIQTAQDRLSQLNSEKNDINNQLSGNRTTGKGNNTFEEGH